jgi:ubiquinone/menaquinone biosynthesis C-methylase UbiE
MKLNRLEFMAMNNPVRAFILEKYEAGKLRSMSSVSDIRMALEIGCGNGSGAAVIRKIFCPEQLVSIDIDERMIETAQRKNKDKSVTFRLMDATNLDFPDNSFDAIFDFGMIHHVPDWKNCIREMRRVIKESGEIIIEDLSIESFSRGIGKAWYKLSDHPYEQMYSRSEFRGFMLESGFEIKQYRESNPLGMVRLFFMIASCK